MNYYAIFEACMPIIFTGTIIFFAMSVVNIFPGTSSIFRRITAAGYLVFLILDILFFLTAAATCHIVNVPACQTVYEQRQAQSLLTQAAQTEEALLFTPTPTAAPYATAVRATAQAMRESALATLYPEGTPIP